MSSAAKSVSTTSSAAASSTASAVATTSAASAMAASSMSSASTSVWAISMAAASLTSSAASMASSASIFTRSSSPTMARASGAIIACMSVRPPASTIASRRLAAQWCSMTRIAAALPAGIESASSCIRSTERPASRSATARAPSSAPSTMPSTPPAWSPIEPAGDRAEAHPLVLGQVGQVHRVLDVAVPVLLDEDDVDEADHAALPRPAQLGHDPAGRLELVEPDHEHLDRAGHVLVCHVAALLRPCSPMSGAGRSPNGYCAPLTQAGVAGASCDAAAVAAALIAPAVSSSTGTVLTCSACRHLLGDGVGVHRRDEREDPRGARRDDAGELLLDLDPVVEVARLARRGTGDAERDRAGHDRGRQEDRRDHAADDAPLEARARAVVGHLLDVELALLVRLDHEDAVDLEQARDLGVDEIVIRAHRQGRVRESGDDERMGPLSSDRALGEHPLLVRHLARDDDGVVGVGGRRRLGGRLLVGHLDTSAPRGRREHRPPAADRASCARVVPSRSRGPSRHVDRMRGHPDVRTVGRVAGRLHPPLRRKAPSRER